MKKITQKQMAFYMLYKSHKENKEKYIEVWRFIGEIYMKELSEYGFMSYTCVHRTFEIFDENPGLVERRKVTGKSGAKYYEYRISLNVTPEMIKDEKLKEIRNKIIAYNTKLL